ncbi:hypothetical protein ACH5RR_034589 [Cinchona calisaya]|uniref:Methyl-CpG-binding domain-containing protein 8 n=1 Tax=Cinchona calisaya TaxID=153742 RepID=A0ABD2YBC2_9GENT
MATATVDSTITTEGGAAAAASNEPPLQVDSLPTVDLSLLSQSELYSLSLCSPLTFDPLRCDDVVIPKIDRSVFNESAGSRKQTYSRLRLAPASAVAAASPASLRRRTPHLRHTSNLPHQYLDSSPEKAENHQILALLKQLFGLDSSTCANDDRNEELVPIRVDYSHSVPQLFSQSANDLHLVPQSANVGLTGLKRKRGRPRKNENAVVLFENKVVESHCDNANVVSVMNSPMDNAIVANENVEDRDKEDRDKEIMNRDGIEVDLFALGAMEDPYEQELRRRTEGMGTEEQLLEFLRGLNGQWGSRRKKRRIVDASEFANALPKGWALLLSVKKKAGHAWLFCRRYISPNGRQFVSCKEISSYLLSLHGIQGSNQLTCTQSNADSETANSMAFVSAVGQAVIEEKIEMNPVSQISPSIASIPGNFEVEVTLKTEELPAVQVGEVLHCEKCNLTFERQDDFLQHQISSHRRRRSKGGESITDGVIIKEGKFECQFCHKTFLERHRYNGHVGAHVRNQVKCSDGIQATDVKESVGTGSFDFIPPGSMGKTSIGSENNIVAEIPTANAADVLNSYLSQSSDKKNGDLKESNSIVGKVEEVMGSDALKIKLCVNSEAVLPNKGNNNFCGTSGGASVVTGGTEVGQNNKSCDLQGVRSVSCSPVLLDQTPSTTEKSMMEFSVNPEEPQCKTVPGSDLHGSNENEVSCGIDLDDGDLSHTVMELTHEDNKFIANVSISDFDKKHDELDVSIGIGDQQHQKSEDHLLRNVDDADGKSIHTVSGSDQDIGSNYSVLAPFGDKEKCDNVLNYVLPSTDSRAVGQQHNKMYAGAGNTPELNKDSSTGLQEERDIGNCTVLPSWNEQVNFNEEYNNEVSACFIDGHGQPKASESSLLSLSPFEVNCGVEQYVDGLSARQMEEPKVDDVQNVRNNEFFPFSDSSNPIDMDAMTSSKYERRPEFRSFFPSANAGENTATFHSNLAEESGKQSSESVFLAQSFSAEASHEGYNINKIFAPQVDVRKLNNTGNSKNHDLCLASDNGASSNSVQLGRYPAESFDVQSGIKQMFGVQSNLNNVAHIGLENPRETRSFGIDLHDSAFSDRTCEFDSNFNMIYQDKVWEAPKIDEVGNSSNKFMVGFDGSNPQPVEDVMSGSIWRTGEENLLQAGTSIPLVQSSNSFRTFDIFSEKGGLFGVNQKYEGGTGFEGSRLGRSEPVEYSFMTTQSSNSIPGESKGLSYEVNTGQGFEHSFWLGKDALMSNVTDQNQVSTVCVWCRNEFYQDPIPSEAQTGAIGSMCPACSSKVSQFNVL